MPLVSMKQLLDDATRHKYAVGYFESFNMDSLFAVLEAAENKKSPVVIGFGGQFINSAKRKVKDSVYCFGALAREAAARAGVPAAVLLNEADDEDMVYQGMNAGFNAVMYQNAREDFERTTEITKAICRVAHMLGVDVESEVGELPSSNISDGSVTGGQNTDIRRAKLFAGETNIDALAVAVGNIHLLEGKKAAIDFELLAALRNELPIPLVLHGGTGIAPEDVKKSIKTGVAKINVGTALKRAYIEAVRGYLDENDVDGLDPHAVVGWGGSGDMIARGRDAIVRKTEEFIGIFGSAGRA